MRPRQASIALVLSAVLSACTDHPEKEAALKPPVVTVAYPLVRKVQDYVEFTGQLSAKEMVEIRARVTGYLDKVFFKEGDDVVKGDDLYQIDPRPYQAELDRALGAEAQVEARLTRLEADFRRAQKLVAANAMSREDFDKIAG
jgi:RND family efflux transporter MFP subunit